MLNHKVTYATIKTVIHAVNEAEEKGEQYNAGRKTYTKEAHRKIQKDSFEMHLLTKFKSAGSSYKTCTAAINAQCRASKNLPPLSVTSIYNAIKLSNHCVNRTKSIPQSNNNNLIWRQARYNWFTQLLYRTGGLV
mmetsp:Transcript_7261/g.9219  ORF Transcript_7261/g.9219 Transcript_7261/m.9219 type:complete len:135 (+) Transcript_7261:316-720(+)